MASVQVHSRLQTWFGKIFGIFRSCSFQQISYHQIFPDRFPTPAAAWVVWQISQHCWCLDFWHISHPCWCLNFLTYFPLLLPGFSHIFPTPGLGFLTYFPPLLPGFLTYFPLLLLPGFFSDRFPTPAAAWVFLTNVPPLLPGFSGRFTNHEPCCCLSFLTDFSPLLLPGFSDHRLQPANLERVITFIER